MAKIANMQEVRIEQIKPYERNAKIHGDEQIGMLMNSIREFGFLSPCLVERDTYNLIAGHGRVEAAKRLGMETVPCVFVEDLTEEQRKAYILADNKLAELAGWDFALLESELEDIENINMSDFGFDEIRTDVDFENLFADAPEKEKEPKQIQCPHCGLWFET